ncbi:MAG: hypothetical protein QME58_06910 [Bacteroidota bacterium]|nr:hypothetical protein [Bacteroidota bacterium]
MSHKEFITRVVEILEKIEIPYMFTGSIGSSFHGEPRATNDVDVVITLTQEQLHKLINSFGNDYYVSESAAYDAFDRHTMFNVIDNKTGWKADFIILKMRPFSIQEFKRRKLHQFGDINVFIVSPEDAILSKLEWAKETLSEKQFQDALGVAVVQWKELDKEYLRIWAVELNIQGAIENLLNQAEKIQSEKEIL